MSLEDNRTPFGEGSRRIHDTDGDANEALKPGETRSRYIEGYRIVRKDPRGLWEIDFTSETHRQNVPEILRGKFTKWQDLERAILEHKGLMK